MLAPGGKVFLVDSLLNETSTAQDHAPIDDSGVVERRLNDGSRFRIVKRFYEPAPLLAQLQGLGWSGTLQATQEFFLYGALTHGNASPGLQH